MKGRERKTFLGSTVLKSLFKSEILQPRNSLFMCYDSYLTFSNPKKKVEIHLFHPFAICYFERVFFFLLFFFPSQEGIKTISLDNAVTVRGQCFSCEFSALIEAWDIIAGNEMLNSDRSSLL